MEPWTLYMSDFLIESGVDQCQWCGRLERVTYLHHDTKEALCVECYEAHVNEWGR